MCSCMWGGCTENVCPHQLRLINWMLRQLTFILTILKAENLRPRCQQTRFSSWWVSSSGLGDDHVLAVSSHDREVMSFTSLLIRALKQQPTPVFLPGESQGRGSLVGCRLWGRRVRHDWSDLAAAAAAASPSRGLYSHGQIFFQGSIFKHHHIGS